MMLLAGSTERKVLLIFFVLVIITALAFLAYKTSGRKLNLITPSSPNQLKAKPLDKYSIEALSQINMPESQIMFGKTLKEETSYVSSIFYFYDQGKKVSGLANFPNKTGRVPVIIMFRGYIDRQTYTTGTGTQRAGEFFAQNGFITLAPDFLGYGDSDNPSASAIEERFQTYTTAITLLRSIKNLNLALSAANFSVRADSESIGIWGHSNGGQIALTVLEITQKTYPTVLWAPVSKPFPYSVLYYTDSFEDHGRALRKIIAEFETDYDSEKYSLTNFLDKINAPMQLHQGAKDEAVPQSWSDQLVDNLKNLGKEVDYFTYPGDDHNFAQISWETVVRRNIAFFQKFLIGLNP